MQALSWMFHKMMIILWWQQLCSLYLPVGLPHVLCSPIVLISEFWVSWWTHCLMLPLQYVMHQMVYTGMNVATQIYCISWLQNYNTELMIAMLFLTAPKGTYKDNECIGTCVWTMMDVCAKQDSLNINW